MNLWNSIPIDSDVRNATRRISRVRLINTSIAVGFGLLALLLAGGAGRVAFELLWPLIEAHPDSRISGLPVLAAVFVFLGTCRAAAFFFRRPRPEDVAFVGQDV